MAAYGAIIVHATFGLRRRIGIKTWRKIHYASFFVFSAAIAHGLLAGSDSGASGGRGLYIAAGVLVTALGVYRALGSGVRRRPRSAPTG
jgi:sulfoxide reductase heme-binding subunit YedZ